VRLTSKDDYWGGEELSLCFAERSYPTRNFKFQEHREYFGKGSKRERYSGYTGYFEVVQEIFPDHYFEYQFLDGENLAAYQADEQWERIIFYA